MGGGLDVRGVEVTHLKQVHGCNCEWLSLSYYTFCSSARERVNACINKVWSKLLDRPMTFTIQLQHLKQTLQTLQVILRVRQ
jgi:hypothetical protein